jgi:hypothetical protein
MGHQGGLVSAMEATATARLTHKPVGTIRGRFFVPRYQRGYRWDATDVVRLLDDILASGGTDYSLQPVVVKMHRRGATDNDHEWELIDGQQRLTTLYVLLRYMQEHASCGVGAPYSLRYETRVDSETYLQTLDPAIHDTNIDYFHLYQAHVCIHRWFEAHGDKRNSIADTIHGYLFKSIRVIWYEAPGDTSATALFTRLNVGRIPLTDAELVKAALLTAVRSTSDERAHEVAAQWDGIERDLHDPDTWAFVAGLGATSGANAYPTRISLLLDTLADKRKRPDGKRPRYHTFDHLRAMVEREPKEFWQQVVTLHARIRGWLEQPVIHNKIGFLVANKVTLGEIATAADGEKKSAFERALVERIRSLLDLSPVAMGELRYGKHSAKILQVLLLMNVETATGTGTRFPFFRHSGHKWSLEHIHAQQAESLNRAEQWKTWLLTHQAALAAMALDTSATDARALDARIVTALSDITEGKFSGEKFSTLSAEVLKILGGGDALDHSIRNIALLSSADNSRLSNSVFEVKRQMILELDRSGSYVPACTRNVFLKYYAQADAQHPHFWSELDKDSYFKEILARLHTYLRVNTQESNR